MRRDAWPGLSQGAFQAHPPASFLPQRRTEQPLVQKKGGAAAEAGESRCAQDRSEAADRAGNGLGVQETEGHELISRMGIGASGQRADRSEVSGRTTAGCASASY